jgi:hypothetical protein
MARGKDESANHVRYLEELYAGNNAGAWQILELHEEERRIGSQNKKNI